MNPVTKQNMIFKEAKSTSTIAAQNIFKYSKRKRRRTSSEQLIVLEKAFQTHTQYPSMAARTQIGQQLDMTPRGVQIWFQNRRAKARSRTHITTTSPTSQKVSPSTKQIVPATSPLISSNSSSPSSGSSSSSSSSLPSSPASRRAAIPNLLTATNGEDRFHSEQKV